LFVYLQSYLVTILPVNCFMSATLQAELTKHEPIICLINLLLVAGANSLAVNYYL